MKGYKEQGQTHLLWKETSRKKLLECRIFDVYSVNRISPEGKNADFVLLDTPDWVTIIPLLDDSVGESFVMVRQFRQGEGDLTVEFPAGTVDEGENPEDTAQRELLEETGYSAGSIVSLGEVNSNPAFLNNRVHTFLATGLKKIQEQSPDIHEYLDVLIVPLEEVIREMGRGPYLSGISMISLFWYLRWKNEV